MIAYNSGPLISIVLPVYNVEMYLNRCFESIKNQTYKNLEIIFVDDGSTDASGEICENFRRIDERVIVYHKKNGGLSDARNYGIDRFRGDYITFVDADDFIDHDYVEYLYDLIRKYDTNMSICQHRTLYDSGLIKENKKYESYKLSAEKCLWKLMYNDGIDTSAYAKLISKHIVSNTHFPKGKIFEDLATMYKFIIASGEVAVGEQAKYNYLYHSNSISNDKFNSQYLEYSGITDEMVNECTMIFNSLYIPGICKRVRSRFSVLNLLINTDTIKEYKNEKWELVDFIKKNRNIVLVDKNVHKRDKLAIVLISFSFAIYKLVWKMHRRRIMNRKMVRSRWL